MSAYEINSKNLSEANCPFGIYISREESQMASNFSVCLLFKHLSGVMKVAEYIEGSVAMAMETIAEDAAVVFMFTKGRDIQYTIGVSNVRFTNLDH